MRSLYSQTCFCYGGGGIPYFSFALFDVLGLSCIVGPFSLVMCPISSSVSTCFPLLRVLAFKCCLGLLSVLLSKLPGEHSEFALVSCPDWFLSVWINAWIFLKTMLNSLSLVFMLWNLASVLIMKLVKTSSVVNFLSCYCGGCWCTWGGGGGGAHCYESWPQEWLGWFLHPVL